MSGLMGMGVGDSVQWAETQPQLNAVTIIQSDRAVTALALRCCDPTWGRIIEGDEVFTTLEIPGMDRLGNIGEPQLPFKSVCIAVPSDQVTITVVDDEFYEVDVGLVYPAQEPDPDCETEKEPEFMLDRAIYMTDAFYPSDITCTVEQGRIRGVPFAQVGFNPVQYNPVTGIARVHEAIDLEVRWGGFGGFSMAENLKSKYFADTFQNVFLNWGDFSECYADELAPAQETPRGPTGCEYLIITAPLFADAANTLAAWKIERGIDTRVVETTETGTTSAAISSYILNAYTNWMPAPSYVLLLGDADHINTNYVNVHPYYGMTTGTDLWYYTIDGSDFVADIFYGRIPVDTAAQAENYINKIVDYEIDPPYNSGYYNNITVAAYFQDSGDGYEDRRFTRTSEEVRDYLMTNQSYDVERIYVTDAGTTPTNWNNDINYYGWPVPGAPIPAELLRSSGFPWNGGVADIKAAVDSGTFILNHRDHGSRAGWGDPYFTTTEVATLDNGELLPIVYSINCETGWFDSETDDPGYGTSTECFCEEFLRKVDGGCVCIFGATRVSYSGYNDFMCRGWYDAVWPDFDLSIGGTDPMYRMGDIHNYGKWYMMNHYAWGDPWGYAELTSEIFHVYGDPTMEMWTAEPMDMTVSHPPSYPFGTTQVVVNVSVDGAFVSLVQDGEIVGTGYSSGGHATIAVNPLQGGVVTVTVTMHNYRPYQGSIIVPSGPHDLAVKNLDVPPTGVAGIAVDVDANIFNLGTNDESDVEVQLLVDGFMEDSTVISSLLSGSITPATLSWTPTFGGSYFVQMYTVPVTGETVTWNNILNDTTFIVAYPDIALSQASFDFCAAPEGTDMQTLTVGNEGLAALDYEIHLPSNNPTILHEDFSASPTAWTITNTAGTAWTWSAANQRMENTYGYPNSGYLDSPVMNCAGRTGAALSFWHFWQANYAGGTQDGYVRGSIDGGSTWPYLVDEFHHNNPATETATKFYSIPWADGHSLVRIRFDIYNYDDWYWRMDNFYLNCTALPTCNWLTIDPDNGTVAPLDGADVALTASAAALPIGMYFTNLTVVSNDLDEPSLTIPVTFTVSDSLPLYAIDLTGKAAPCWVFVSYPHGLSGNILTILNDATLGDGGTTWSVAKWYNPQTPADPWKTYRVGGTANDMPTVTNSMGVWLYLTANGGDQALTLGANGAYPSSAVNINLYTGWNLVGYPSATSRLASATLPAEADIVSIWQAAAPFVQDFTALGSVTMSHGNAYWVHVTADCVWTVQP